MRRTISFDCSIIAGGNVALESSLDDLLLHGRVPFKPAHGDVIHVEHRQLRERWKARLHADDRLLRVNSHSEIVERDLADIAPDACGIIGVVCQRLGISEQQELAMIFLELKPTLQRTDVVTEVKRAGRAVAGQDNGAGLCGGHGGSPGEGRRQTGRIITHRKALGPEVRRRRV
jgi:hypothetical protein